MSEERSAARVSPEAAAALLRWAGAELEPGRAAELAERLGHYRSALALLERHFARETEPVGLRLPDA